MSEYIWKLTQKELNHKCNSAFDEGVSNERREVVAIFERRYGNTTDAKSRTVSISLESLIALIERNV
jgi:hypothetical protein